MAGCYATFPSLSVQRRVLYLFYSTSGSLPPKQTISMPPPIYREGSTESDASNASGSSQSGGLRWRHCEELCGVFHPDGCKICKDWRIHCIPLRSSEIVKEFRYTRDEALESERVCYAQESEAINREIAELTHELEEVKGELERMRRIEDTDHQPWLQVAGKICEAIGQLGAASEVKPAYHPPPSSPSSRPRKRPCLTRTISPCPSRPTMPRDVIWVDSESEGEHGKDGEHSC